MGTRPEFAQPAPPVCDAGGIGLQVAAVIGKRVARPAVHRGQAPDRDLEIRGARCIGPPGPRHARRTHRRARKGSPEQGHEPRLSFHHAACASGARVGEQVGQAGSEHDLVADTLLRDDEKRAALERLAVPAGRRARARDGIGAVMPRLEFIPARGEFAAFEVEMRAHQPRFVVVRPACQDCRQAVQRFIVLPRLAEHPSQVGARGVESGVQFERLAQQLLAAREFAVLPSEYQAEETQRLLRERIENQEFLEPSRRRAALSAPVELPRQRDRRAAVRRIADEEGLVGGFRERALAAPLQRLDPPVQGGLAVRIVMQRKVEMIERGFGIAEREAGLPEQRVQLGILGRIPVQRIEEPRRIGEPALAHQGARPLDQIRWRRRAHRVFSRARRRGSAAPPPRRAWRRASRAILRRIRSPHTRGNTVRPA